VGPSVKEPVVICLLTDSAAEEAGLQIGDVVLSVNGTEVTSVEHAEAVHLAKKGRWASYRLQSSLKMLGTHYTGSSKVGRWQLERDAFINRTLYPSD
jgi:S1-C subfamily serine protease